MQLTQINPLISHRFIHQPREPTSLNPKQAYLPDHPPTPFYDQLSTKLGLYLPVDEVAFDSRAETNGASDSMDNNRPIILCSLLRIATVALLLTRQKLNKYIQDGTVIIH
jgi:hypothetical protein